MMLGQDTSGISQGKEGSPSQGWGLGLGLGYRQRSAEGRAELSLKRWLALHRGTFAVHERKMSCHFLLHPPTFCNTQRS